MTKLTQVQTPFPVAVSLLLDSRNHSAYNTGGMPVNLSIFYAGNDEQDDAGMTGKGEGVADIHTATVNGGMDGPCSERETRKWHVTERRMAHVTERRMARRKGCTFCTRQDHTPLGRTCEATIFIPPLTVAVFSGGMDEGTVSILPLTVAV